MLQAHQDASRKSPLGDLDCRLLCASQREARLSRHFINLNIILKYLILTIWRTIACFCTGCTRFTPCQPWFGNRGNFIKIDWWIDSGCFLHGTFFQQFCRENGTGRHSYHWKGLASCSEWWQGYKFSTCTWKQGYFDNARRFKYTTHLLMFLQVRIFDAWILINKNLDLNPTHSRFFFNIYVYIST